MDGAARRVAGRRRDRAARPEGSRREDPRPRGHRAVARLGLAGTRPSRVRDLRRPEADARRRPPRENDRDRLLHGRRVPPGWNAGRAGGRRPRGGEPADRPGPPGARPPRELRDVAAFPERDRGSRPRRPPAGPAAARDEPVDRRNLAGLRRGGPRLRPRRRRGSLRRRRRAGDPLRERRDRLFHGRHGACGAGPVAAGRHRRDRRRGGRRERRRIPGPSRNGFLRAGAPVRESARGRLRRGRAVLRHLGLPERAVGGLRRRGRGRGPGPLRVRHRRLLLADARSPVRRGGRRPEPSLRERRAGPVPGRLRRVGRVAPEPVVALVPLRRLRRRRTRRPRRHERLRAEEPLPQRLREALRGRHATRGRGGSRVRNVRRVGGLRRGRARSTSTPQAATRSGTSCTNTRRCRSPFRAGSSFRPRSGGWRR